MQMTVDPGSPQSRESATDRRPWRRLALVTVIGVACIAGALFFRSSGWAKEYRLQRASLDVTRSIAEQNPRDPVVLYYLGTKYFNSGFAHEAAASFHTAAALDPKMTRAHLGAAVAYEQTGDDAQAYASAKEALLADPKSVDAQFLVASLVAKVSKEKGLDEFRKLTEMAPKRADAWHGRGLCEATLRQWGTAVEPLTRAVELAPDNPVYKIDLGKVLVHLGRFEQAKVHLDQAVHMSPTDPAGVYYLGRALLALAKTDAELQASAERLEQAAELLRQSSPEDAKGRAEMLAARAEALLRLQEEETAEQLVREARRLDPATAAYLRQLAEVKTARGQVDEARALMREYADRYELESEIGATMERLKQTPDDPTLRLRFARMLVENGDIPQAYTQYTIVHKLKPNQPAEVRAEFRRVESEFKKLQKAAPQTALPVAGAATAR